jgi:hypothetical protein
MKNRRRRGRQKRRVKTRHIKENRKTIKRRQDKRRRKLCATKEDKSKRKKGKEETRETMNKDK